MRSLLPAILLLLGVLSGSLGAQDAAPLPPRPDISDYTDQSRFVSDVLAWEKQAASYHSTTTRARNHSADENHDWHHITGPEDLDTALQNADGYVQPHYKEKLRFNRTTHLSFPLAHLPYEEMASQTADDSQDGLPLTPLTEMELLPERLIERLEMLQAFTAQDTSQHAFAPGEQVN